MGGFLAFVSFFLLLFPNWLKREQTRDDERMSFLLLFPNWPKREQTRDKGNKRGRSDLPFRLKRSARATFVTFLQLRVVDYVIV